MRLILLLLTVCKICTGFQISQIHESQEINDAAHLKSTRFWVEDAKRTLRIKLSQTENRNKAKNVIFFIGDGMSVSTVTASRIYDGQVKGIVGERNSLFMERFPYLGLSKTYCADRQVADSACTATAYHSGVKANYETIGVTAKVKRTDCDSAIRKENQLDSISTWAQEAGKASGIVTTTRITHASPSGAYAHTAHRDYESDADIVNMGNDPKLCVDIARQLVENPVSRNFKVVMGGGAGKLLPNGTVHTAGYLGERLDGKNLIKEWMKNKQNAQSVFSRQQLLDLDIGQTDNLIGIFANSHLKYNLDNDGSEPTLKEMTEAAIRVLKKEPNGFFLFVEGGRIDHAHHETKAKKALDETVQFDAAIQRAYELTNPDDTLIVISADHGHTMTINGYPKLGNSITGVGTDLTDIDNLPYTTLSYANGPAFSNFLYSIKQPPSLHNLYQRLIYGSGGREVKRYDVRRMSQLGDKDFQYPAAAPMVDETHGGGDVAIYASGPWSHLFTGVLEQNVLPVFMSFAACIGPENLTACNLTKY